MKKLKILMVDGLCIQFTHLVKEDICQNGKFTIWVYKGQDLLTSFHLHRYIVKYEFQTDERIFYSLRRKF